MGLDAEPDDVLAGCNYGRWTGLELDEVLAAEPAGVSQWLADPAATPHGGESVLDLLARVGQWLDARIHDRRGPNGRDPVRTLLAVADPTVIRAAVVHAVEAGPRSIWRIDVAPLSRTVLVGEPGRWSLRELSSGG